jgi:hypothetical protein
MGKYRGLNAKAGGTYSLSVFICRGQKESASKMFDKPAARFAHFFFAEYDITAQWSS